MKNGIKIIVAAGAFIILQMLSFAFFLWLFFMLLGDPVGKYIYITTPLVVFLAVGFSSFCVAWCTMKKWPEISEKSLFITLMITIFLWIGSSVFVAPDNTYKITRSISVVVSLFAVWCSRKSGWRDDNEF